MNRTIPPIRFLNRTAGGAAEPVAASDDTQSASATYAELTNAVTSLANEKKYTEAIAKVDAYLKEYPDRAEPWVLKGQVILRQGEGADLGAASTAFTRAQIIIADYKPALGGQIEVQARINPPMAISLCERYLRIYNDDIDFMFLLATLLAQDPNRREESLEWIGKAMAIEKRPTFIRFRSYLLIQLARPDEAIAELTEFIKAAGASTAEDEMTLAEAHLAKNDKPGARERLQAAAKLIPVGDSQLKERMKKLEALTAAEGTN